MMIAGEIPFGGYPGQYIYVNTEPFPYDTNGHWKWTATSPSGARVKTSLIHAIGHCLGLAHTQNGTSTPYPTGMFDELDQGHPRIPESSWLDDSQSIMKITEHNYNNTITKLSDGDKEALSILYPTFSGGEIAITRGQTTTTITAGTTPPQFINIRDALGGEGQITYKWQKSVNSQTNWNDILYTNSATYQEQYPLIEDTWYRRQAISEGETVNSNVVTINVRPDPGAIAGNQTVVPGVIPALLTSVRDAIGGTYQWQKRTGNSNWTNISGGASRTYQPPTLTASTDYQRVAKSGNLEAASNMVSVMVFSPSISGPDNPEIGKSVIYSVPTTLPSGVTFNGWTVTGGNYRAPNGLNSRNLTIIFDARTRYTLTAKFTFSGGRTYNVTKTVDVIHVVIPDTPIIVVVTTNNEPNVWMPDDVGQFYLSNYWRTGITVEQYEWDSNRMEWLDFSRPEMPTLQNAPNAYPSWYYTYPEMPVVYVWCRVKVNGTWSGWSDMAYMNLDYSDRIRRRRAILSTDSLAVPVHSLHSERRK